MHEIDLTPLSNNLLELHLNDNRLNTIVDLVPAHFTKLRYLNIGQNELSCAYLTKFASDFAGHAHFEEWDQFAEICLPHIPSDTGPIQAVNQTIDATNATETKYQIETNAVL